MTGPATTACDTTGPAIAPAAKEKSQPSPKFVTLELFRFLAATWVVWHHVAQREGGGRVAGFLAVTGQFPVILFFVLSGFVIGLRQMGRTETMAEYVRSRFSRIYPIYLLAILASWLFVLLHSQVPGTAATSSSTVSLPVLLGNVFMLQGPTWAGVRGCVEPWAANSVFWTLSFEWWFYIVFWLINRYFRPTVGRNLVLGFGFAGWLAFMVEPLFPFLWLTLFTTWWAGLELAREFHETSRLTFKRQLPVLLTTVALCAAPYAMKFLTLNLGGLGLAQHLITKWLLYGLGFVVLAILFQDKLLKTKSAGSNAILKLGGLSYGVYALHLPVIVLLTDVIHPGFLVGGLLCTAVAVAVGYWAEFGFQPVAVRAVKGAWKARS